MQRILETGLKQSEFGFDIEALALEMQRILETGLKLAASIVPLLSFGKLEMQRILETGLKLVAIALKQSDKQILAGNAANPGNGIETRIAIAEKLARDNLEMQRILETGLKH